MKLKTIIEEAHKVIQNYPKAKNGQSFLTMKNGRKVFFNRFLKKYGVNGKTSQYKESDIKRRLILVEFFEYFMNMDLVPAREKGRFLLDSIFYRMVIIETKNKKANKYELLSFYPK